MKVFLMDLPHDEGRLIDLALRAAEADHEVRYWTSRETPVGKGLVARSRDWRREVDWADLTVTSGNCDYPEGFTDCLEGGHPILATGDKAAELELDRGKGQEILGRYSIPTLPFKVAGSIEEAIEFIVKERKPFAIKPWGGTTDKAMTAVPRSVDEAVFILDCWKSKGLKGELMLQEVVKGVEMGIAGWFGPGGWCKALEESFEHKRFMNDDLGENTGEMGTVLRHVSRSKLFDLVLDPLSDYLHLCNFRGCASVNCIVDETGTPWPLEFTMRLGWPAFCLTQAGIEGDPVEWMAELVYGRDALEVTTDVIAGIVMTHGDFPKSKNPPEEWTGFPLAGITDKNLPHLHFQEVQDGKAPKVVGGKVTQAAQMLTAGNYILVSSGRGKNVRGALARAYDTAWQITLPSNRMFRTDIGKRLAEDLPLVQKWGFAKGMEF